MKNKIIFRASSNGALMPADKARVEFTEAQIDKMIEVYNYCIEGRTEEIKNKFLEKGNVREQDSITLLSRVTKKLYKKNTIRLSDDLTTGEPDLFEGATITTAEETLDTKTSWSLGTFSKAKKNDLKKDYFWQGQTYMNLTGAKKHTVAFCLVNSTAEIIMQEKQRAVWKYGSGKPFNPEYIEECKQIEINHIFDLNEFMEENPGFHLQNKIIDWKYNIVKEKRMHAISFDRDTTAINKMRFRLLDCRKWIENNLM